MLRNANWVRVGLAVCVVAAGAACGLDNSSGPSAMVTAVTAEMTSGSGNTGPFDFNGTITATGATTVTYRWELSNGDLQPVQQLHFGGAGSLSTAYSFEPQICFGSDQYLWARLDVLEPNIMESPKVHFKRDCLMLVFPPLSPL